MCGNNNNNNSTEHDLGDRLMCDFFKYIDRRRHTQAVSLHTTDRSILYFREQLFVFE